MSVEAPTPLEQRQRQRLIGLKANYEADRLRLLAEPRTKREFLDDEGDLAIFDALHAPSTPRTPREVSDVIKSLVAIDGPNPGLTLPDGKMGNYISGLLSSLGTAIGINRYMIGKNDLQPRTASVNQNRPRMIEGIADAMAQKKIIEAGVFHDKYFLRREPYFVDSLDGFITGYEWALGRRDDYGVDVRAEIDRNPYNPLRTLKPEEALEFGEQLREGELADLSRIQRHLSGAYLIPDK